MSGEMTGRKFRAIVGLMKVPERELMGDILLRESTEPSLPVHVNIGKFVRLDDGQYIDTEDRDKAVKRRQLANAKERLRVSVCKLGIVCTSLPSFGERRVHSFWRFPESWVTALFYLMTHSFIWTFLEKHRQEMLQINVFSLLSSFPWFKNRGDRGWL